MIRSSLTVAVTSLLAISALMLSGCKTSVFAPRTGEYFQATRMGPGVGSYAYALPFMAGAGCLMKGDALIIPGIPLLIVGIPIAGIGFIADICVISPVVDLACLPYDLCQQNHGFYIRIVDSEGKPLNGVRISGTVKHGLEMDAVIIGMTNDAGEVYVNRLSFEHCGFTVHADGYPDKSYSILMKDAEPDAEGRYVFTFRMCETIPAVK